MCRVFGKGNTRTLVSAMVMVASVLLIALNGAQGAENFLVSGTSGAWTSAVTSCRSARGSLALVDTRQRALAFERDVRVGPGVPVWVDRFVGHTAIVTIEGCYGNASLSYDKITVMEDNTLVRCLTQCRDSLYVGMQGPICYCLNAVPASATPVLGITCQSMCPGDTGRFSPPVTECGNLDPRADAVSLYRKVRPGEISLDKNLPDEGECISYNIRSRLWQTDNCTSPRLFVCEQRPCLRPAAISCMTEAPVSVPWIAGRTRCEGSSMRLATVNFTTDDYFFNKPQTQFPLYWTGLHRQEVTVWGNDFSIREVRRSDKCVAMVKGPDGRWSWFLDWCVREHRYACLQNSTETTVVPRPTVSQPSGGGVTARPTARPTMRPTPPGPAVTTTYNIPTVNPNALPVNVTSSASSILTSFIGVPLMMLLVSPLTIIAAVL